MRLGFAGTPHFAVPALDALLRSRHPIVAVLSQPDRPAGRGRSQQPSAITLRAREHGLGLHQPVSLKTPEALATLRSLDLDVLVVVAYGLMLPPAVLALPSLGCFNIHASLLPRWRGAAPIQRALMAGDATTGVTIIRMDSGLDTGPILAVREERIAPGDTAGTLQDRLARQGGELMADVLEQIAAGDAAATPQADGGVTYAAKIAKAEAVIDWRGNAADILRRIRAFNPWPIAETRAEGVQLRLWDAELAPAGTIAHPAAAAPDTRAAATPGTVLTASPEGIVVACGEGALRILRLQLAGRKPLAAAEFIKAQRLAGARFALP